MDPRIPLGGRACRTTPVQNRHLFGAFTSDPLGPSTYLPFVPLFVLNQYCCSSADEPCLNLVTVDAVEILRATGDGVGPLSSEILYSGEPLPAGARRMQNRSQLKAMVDIIRGTTQHRWLMDFNQQIEVHASQVTINLVAPDNFVEVPMRPPFPAGLERQGLVADELIGASSVRIESPTGLTDVILTENVFVAAGEQEVVDVPPYATEVTIYQSTAGAAETAWTMHYGDPNVGSVQAGVIPWIIGGRKTEPEIVMPNVTHLQTGIDAENGRFFTMRWTIRP